MAMNRRAFLKLSSLALAGIHTQACDSKPETRTSEFYDISTKSDFAIGHLILDSNVFPAGKTFSTDYLVVGGGIAGLAAACQLRNRDFVLCELSQKLGGTSGSASYAGEVFSQGAHYDLAYPRYYGAQTLQFLEELAIIHYESLTSSWKFLDQHYLIDPATEGQVFTPCGLRDEIFENGTLKDEFLGLVLSYLGEMKLPTRIIHKNFWSLDTINFIDFLQRSMQLTPSFRQSIDYQMRDDYGAGAGGVSALAGIHYYSCRPYYTQGVGLFSPPQGNAYFIDKMAGTLDPDRIKRSHLVRNIEKSKDGFVVQVINIEDRTVDEYRAKKVIYAGQKHALSYVFPPDAHLFQNNEYAPWLVLNLVLKENFRAQTFWQNEFLTNDSTFLGFIDSASQAHKGGARVLTAYYCFNPKQRLFLANIENNAQAIVRKTVENISLYFNQEISRLVDKAFITVLGHAMPIPKPHYLFDDKNQRRCEQNLVYAGVDNSRLPLLFEALDSGIQAVDQLDSR